MKELDATSTLAMRLFEELVGCVQNKFSDRAPDVKIKASPDDE